MDHLQRLLAAKPAAVNERKSWLIAPKKKARVNVEKIVGGRPKRRRPRRAAVDKKLDPDLGDSPALNFDEALVSCSTTAARKSHLKKIAAILSRNCCDPASRPIDDEALLDRHFTAEGMHMVASALAENNFSSGPNYISTWSCSVSETRQAEIGGFLERKRKKVNRTLLKFGKPARQAIELPLIAMCQSESCWQQAPLVQGGPALPVATAVIGTALMLR